MSQTLLFFEQDPRRRAGRPTPRAAKAAAAKARADAKEKEEREKPSRRLIAKPLTAANTRPATPSAASAGIPRAPAGPTATPAARPSFTPPTPTPSPRSAPAAGPDGGPGLRAAGLRPGPAGDSRQPRPAAKGKPSALLLADPKVSPIGDNSGKVGVRPEPRLPAH